MKMKCNFAHNFMIQTFFELRWNLKNLRRGLNLPNPGFKLSAGLNLETFDTILSETNHI